MELPGATRPPLLAVNVTDLAIAAKVPLRSRCTADVSDPLTVSNPPLTGYHRDRYFPREDQPARRRT